MADASTATSMPSKPVLLLLHGAWHLPQHYATFVSQLEGRGYTVRCPRMPSCNDASPPNKFLDDDVWCARKTALEYLDKGQDVAVLMHSYGGVVGTNAMANLHESRKVDGQQTGRIVALVYFAAFIPFENQGLAGLFGGQLPPWLTSNPDTKVVDIDDPQWHFYNDLPEKERDKWAQQLVRHAVDCQYEPVRDQKLKDEIGERVAWREVKNLVYLVCANDQGIPEFVQRGMVERLETEGGLGKGAFKIEVLEAGHSPFLSMPDKTADVIEKVL